MVENCLLNAKNVRLVEQYLATHKLPAESPIICAVARIVKSNVERHHVEVFSFSCRSLLCEAILRCEAEKNSNNEFDAEKSCIQTIGKSHKRSYPMCGIRLGMEGKHISLQNELDG